MTTDDPLLQQALELAAQATPENFEEIIKKAQKLPIVYELVVILQATRRDVKLVHRQEFTKWIKNRSMLLGKNSLEFKEALRKTGFGQ